jgi:hypothetical protein
MPSDDEEYDEYISPPAPPTPRTPTSAVRKYFPETVILSISTHGSIEANKKSFSFEEVIPDSKVIIANVTAPGVCNYSNSYHTESMNEILMDEYESFDKTKSIEEFVPLAIRSIKLYDYFNILKVKKSQKDHSPRTKNYMRLFNRGYNYQIRNNKDHIIDKTYEITPEENKERMDLREQNKTNNSIIVLNMKDPYGKQGVDLLDIVPPTISVGNHKILTLRKAIEYLNKNGAKNIVIFDYSCNAYTSTEVVTPRHERSLRRQYIKDSEVRDSTKKRKKTYSGTSKNKKSSSNKTKKYMMSNEDLKLLKSINMMPTRKIRSANDANPKKSMVIKQKNTI